MLVSAKLLPIVLVPVVAVLVWVIVRSLRLIRQGRGATARRLVSATLGAWLVTLILVTTPGRGAQPGRHFELIPFGFDEPLSWRANELVVNALMFVPLGLLLPLIVRQRATLWVAICGFTISTLIEIYQYAAASGRAADSTDILLNTTGAVLAAIIAHRTYARSTAREEIPQTRHGEIRA